MDLAFNWVGTSFLKKRKRVEPFVVRLVFRRSVRVDGIDKGESKVI